MVTTTDMKSEYSSCIVCGRKVKNRVYHRDMVIHICPRHLKGKNKKEVSEYLDSLIKNRSKKVRQYEDMMKSILIIENRMSTLSDEAKTWMDVIGQRRLEDYKISKDIIKLSSGIDELSKAIDEINRSLRAIQYNPRNTGEYDKLNFLNSLLKEYDMVHYKVEDGIITVYLDRNLEPKKFRELNKRLRNRGYAYDHRTYKWVKSIFK